MQATPFGDRLKREREMRGVTLEEIAVATRISPRFLEALETERWDQLPGGAFNRGFVRSVARFLGLDEDSLLGEYSLAARGKSEAVPVDTGPELVRRRQIAGVVLLICLVAVGLGGWLVFHRYTARVFVWAKSHDASGSGRQTTPVPAQSPAGAASASNTNPVLTPSLPNDTASAAQPDPQFSATPSVSASALDLTVEAGKTATVKVVSDGKTVFSGSLNPGTPRNFEARQRFDVSASDSSAVLLELNGQTLPPLGAPGQPGSVSLTHDDLKKAEGGSH